MAACGKTASRPPAHDPAILARFGARQMLPSGHGVNLEVGLTTCREFPAMALSAGLILAITVPSIWLSLVLVPIIARSFSPLPLR